MMDDPELQEIFTDPAHQEVVDLLKTARPTTPPLDPHFRSYLRAKLMDEARRSLPRSSSRPWYAFGFRGRTVALSMGAVAAGFLVVLGVQVYLHNQSLPTTEGQVALITPPIANKTNVATAAEPIQLQFTGPVDKNAIADSVQIEPATSVTKQWVGSTLVIIPDHPLAPNTNYTVSLKPKAATPAATSAPAVKPTPTAAPTPVVVHFSTVRAPIPPVTPPSFTTGNLTYGNDNRLDQSGTILTAVWTSSGQILATRPAGLGGPGGLATPTTSPTASGSPAATATTDVWLLSPSGTPLRNLAPGSSLPAAATSGNLFAAWTQRGGQASLDVRDLQGTLVATVATISGTPDRPATWVGSDRLVYVDGETLKLVDLKGNQLALPTLGKVQKGSIQASASGTLLAVETVDASVLIDLSATPASVTTLTAGATAFAWSSKGDLAYLVQDSSASNLYIAPDGKHPGRKIASSSSGQGWSDLNWAPDAASVLLASKPSGGNGTEGLLVINRDGTAQISLGSKTLEYAQPQWSPRGDLILFTRHDEATGGITFQVASLSTSGANPAEQQAIAEVDRFMQARLANDNAAAQAELDSNGQAAYQGGTASLLSAPNTKFDRYYPVTVQLTKSNPSTFLIGVRTFIARGGTETSFFEEQLTVVQQGQRYVIDGVQASAPQSINHGPTVVAVEVLQTPPGEQVQVRFDADVMPASVTPGTVLIKDGNGNPIEESVTFDPTNHLATLSVKLRPGTYQLVVTTGVTDINGVPIAQEYDAPLVISR